ncbi:MAG TPA: methyltransferase domain-containing protein [Methanobacterium sp.]
MTNENCSSKVKFQTADATKLPYADESFDACILQGFLQRSSHLEIE